MDSKNLQTCMHICKGEVTKENAEEIQNKLKTAPDEKVNDFKTLKLKKTSSVALFSSVLGLFGGGSFYLGQYKRAVCKIIFNILVPVITIAIFLVWLGPVNYKYNREAQRYIEFSVSTTADLADFNYEYNIESETSASPSDAGNDANNKLYDIDFTANINKSSQMFSSALQTVEDEIADISKELKNIEKESVDKNFIKRISAINEAYADFDSGVSINGAIGVVSYMELLTLLKDSLNMPGGADLLEKLNGALKEDVVARDNAVSDNIKYLIKAVNTFSTTDDIENYLKVSGNLHFANLIDLNASSSTLEGYMDGLRTALEDFKQYSGKPDGADGNVEEDYLYKLDDLNELNRMAAKIISAEQNLKNINTVIYGINENLDKLTGETVSDSIQSYKDALTTVNDRNEEVDFATVAQLVSSQLKTLSDEQNQFDEVSVLLDNYLAAYSNNGVDEKIKVFFTVEKDEAENDVEINLMAKYEDKLSEFIIKNKTNAEDNNFSTLYNKLVQTENAVNNIQKSNLTVSAVRSGGVFAACPEFTCSHVADSVLQYYLGTHVNLSTYNPEILLLYYFGDSVEKTDADKKLGISATLKDYYDHAQVIIDKINVYGLNKISVLRTIADNFSKMATEINDLNNLAKTKSEGWKMAGDIITTAFSIYIGIDLFIILVYWVFEYFRDMEKCKQINYKTICNELKNI